MDHSQSGEGFWETLRILSHKCRGVLSVLINTACLKISGRLLSEGAPEPGPHLHPDLDHPSAPPVTAENVSDLGTPLHSQETSFHPLLS